jgi:hypothetical protein
MNYPTYGEQWQKITSAYSNNKLNPYMNCACFIGNMLGNLSCWADTRTGSPATGRGRRAAPFCEDDTEKQIIKYSIGNMLIKSNGYTVDQIIKLENNFLGIIHRLGEVDNIEEWEDFQRFYPEAAEDILYEAMISTLNMLKEIHRERGEDVDNSLVLQRRTKQPNLKNPEPAKQLQ